MTEDEMAGWHHRLNGHEFEQTLRDGEGQESLACAVHAVAKSRTRLSDFTFIFPFHELEKEMATHSRVLAWRIPGTGEPGGLPSTRGHPESDTTEVTQQQERKKCHQIMMLSVLMHILAAEIKL